MVYLFVGQDYHSKNIRLEKIKRQFFSKDLEYLNYDVFFAEELKLLQLQEALKRLPQKAKKRIVLIRDAEFLKKELKEYIISYVKKPIPSCILILDFRHFDERDAFIKSILEYVNKFTFLSQEILDTFKLSKEIERRRIYPALKILHNLILEGTDPEMILGGLRYSWQNSFLSTQEKKKRLSLLLDADLSIKTGKLDPLLALERLIFCLCCF
jgi:DNA polymerase III delta subunit